MMMDVSGRVGVREMFMVDWEGSETDLIYVCERHDGRSITWLEDLLSDFACSRQPLGQASEKTAPEPY